MSFKKEMEDFTGALGASVKMGLLWDQARYYKARADDLEARRKYGEEAKKLREASQNWVEDGGWSEPEVSNQSIYGDSGAVMEYGALDFGGADTPFDAAALDGFFSRGGKVPSYSLGGEVKDFLAAMGTVSSAGLAMDRGRLYRAQADDIEGRASYFGGFDDWYANRAAPDAPWSTPEEAIPTGRSAPVTQQGNSAGSVNPKEMYGYLRSQGADHKTAAWAVASGLAESGLDPNAVHDGGTGAGMFGHRLDRRENLYKFAGTNQPDWQTQARFLLSELTPEQRAQISGARSAEDLTVAQMHHLRPAGYTRANPRAGHRWDDRLAYMNQTLGYDQGG